MDANHEKDLDLEMISDEEDQKEELEHYGTPRHSGRYPWGSGENPYQRYADFLGNYEKLKKKLFSTQMKNCLDSINDFKI